MAEPFFQMREGQLRLNLVLPLMEAFLIGD